MLVIKDSLSTLLKETADMITCFCSQQQWNNITTIWNKIMIVIEENYVNEIHMVMIWYEI